MAAMINLVDIAYVRCAVPDVEVQKRFHTDFGLVATEIARVLRRRNDSGMTNVRSENLEKFFFICKRNSV